MNRGMILSISLLLACIGKAEISYGVSNTFSLGSISTSTSAKQLAICDPEHIKATPNPFNPVVKISVATQKRQPEVSIFSASGKLITKMVTPASGMFAWDASQYPSGLYIIKVTGSNNHRLTKLITLTK
jgi:hypothetical protein